MSSTIQEPVVRPCPSPLPEVPAPWTTEQVAPSPAAPPAEVQALASDCWALWFWLGGAALLLLLHLLDVGSHLVRYLFGS